MKRIFLIFCLLFLIGSLIYSQTGVAINKDGSSPDASAILDVSGSDGGVLIPRMTASQRISISNPAAGLLVYDTDSARFYYYDEDWITIANPHQLGDGNNFAEFEDDGTLVFYGTSTTFDDLQIPGFSVAKKGIDDPDLVTFADNISVYGFSPVSEEEVFFSVQFPHSWKEGSTFYPHIHYSVLTTDTNDSIVWSLEYSWADVNSFFSTSASTISTTVVGGNAYEHQVASFGGISPGTNTDNISSIMVCRLFRDTDNASDTFSDDAIFLQFDIHYEKNTIGSRYQWNK